MTTWGGEQIDLDAYLAKIGYEGERAPTLEVLHALHRAHVTTIPFENVEVALGREVPLDLKRVQEKLVGQARGGYCYEQNTLLAAALERLGFQVAGRGARNRTRGDALLPVTHAVLVVTVEGEQWLVDAGFGWQGLLEPMPLRAGAQVRQSDGWTFAIAEEEGEGILVLRSLRTEGWVDLYAFAPQTLYPVDFVLMNHYSSTHPRSSFLGKVVAHRIAPDARYGFVADSLRTGRSDGSFDERPVAPEELADLLAEVFRIGLSAEDAAAVGRVHPDAG
ncbi:arylamine N-acetyltransferase [Streptomyces sp. NBC_00237]|uniref:arylamine N-acetyltransferase family protein n=1 Tax=Streptomyces sp. NBC_00237 TaxID=2975687 RepID=UPI00225104F9|nr:arylamine N-acetyltransferase [Streptomyces sp. NBC_00237]MCX5203759.1 arylamine N-acetyltransferase [Streptomyces sp. NBC_00237]